MATRQLKVLKTKGTHAVGNLNSIQVKTVAGGAKVTGADIDNFTLVELGFNAEGERTCTQLAAIANKAYLIASPEVRNMGEEMVDFYNEVGEYGRIVVLEAAYTRFESSAFSFNTGVTAATKGYVAHFEPATKKFIISNPASAHANYAGSSAKFRVVADESETDYTLGADTVRLEAIQA